MKRRSFLQTSSLAAGSFFLPSALVASPGAFRPFRPDPDFKGVTIGAITYSFRSMPGTITDLVGYLRQLGLSSTELMGGPAETFAGAPESPPWKRGELTEAEKKERADYQADIKNWRTKAPMSKFKEMAGLFKDAGVNIEVIKFPLDRMSDEEIAYCFRVATTVGARGITLERTDESVRKLAPYADKYKKLIGYHNHAAVNFNSWDECVALSPYQALNLDIGHYVAGTNQSPVPLIQKYKDRILNLHIKDRKKDNGANLPWGQGDTPIGEVLRLMRDEKYKFMATIELEYDIPEGSDAVKEVANCIDFCKNELDK
ncbi:MAG: sugar phosphate isomerase/epimerase [Cyclobacteriaceae bacterium]|nr:sugar phosphate isomerase/epimerase [Cyclobacteriaceae bacterium]